MGVFLEFRMNSNIGEHDSRTCRIRITNIYCTCMKEVFSLIAHKELVLYIIVSLFFHHSLEFSKDENTFI
jgi:hypothetical protein